MGAESNRVEVSIIVPVYNVSAYLNRCIESLVSQSYANIGIILVDDGSADGSSEICNEWAAKDPRIRVIHKPNGGLSSARNAGLEVANSEYVAFVDGDDFVDAGYVEKLFKSARENSADITICNYRFVDENGHEISNDNYTRYTRQGSFDSYEALRLFEDKSYRTFFDVVWNKLFRRELFEGVRFPDGISIVEDIAVMPVLYHRAATLSVVDDGLYNYVYRVESLSHAKRDKQADLKLRIPVMENRLALYREWNIKELCLSHIIHMYPMIKESADYTKADLRSLQKQYRAEYGKGKYHNTPSLSRRIKYMAAAISLDLYNKLAGAK
ncbi:MAG: glycosyltransferase [Lachnospiraceae bacterium]|nr:glycosyltransferase [Lachnospiraceae bacterium]MBR5994210.1 glycosyltransferase [Lachnospiraceae bacterium]